MADLRFYVNDILTHENVGRLFPREYSFGEPLAGIGEARLSITMPSQVSRNSLLYRLIPNRFELEITDGDPLRGGAVIWAGFIHGRVPNPEKMTVDFDATHWKGWFYRRLIPPKTWTNNKLTGDQYTIAYTMVDWACAHVAAHKVVRGTAVSGKTRELTVNPWWSVGEALDNIGKRDGGFEWSLSFRRGGTNGLTESMFELWKIGQARSSSPLLYIDNTRTTNKARVGVLQEDGSIQATRVFATSDGDDPVYSSDEDPTLSKASIILLEDSTTYQDNRNKTLLFDYARAERLSRNNPYSTVAVTIPEDAIRIGSYRTGDRARLRVRDDWRDIDVVGIRITNRSINKTDGSPMTVTVELDMTDVQNVAR